MKQATLNNNTAQHRYELINEGQVVAFAEYQLDGDTVVFVHTEVGAEHGGKGYGSALAGKALQDVRAQHKKVKPVCEFIAGYIGKHPESAELAEPAK